MATVVCLALLLSVKLVAGQNWTVSENATGTEDSGCGSPRYQSGTSGTISSMNYPGNYSNSAHCSWVIEAPEWMQIRIEFNRYFDLETGNDCQYDSVSLFHGRGDEQVQIGEYCRSPRNVTSKGNYMVVTFKSDESNNGDGFSLEWTAIAEESGCGSPKYQNGTSGTISSMDYPYNYDNDADCRWLITVPKGNLIHLRFDHEYFGIESSTNCKYDSVGLYGMDGRNIVRFCGQTAPDEWLSTDNQILVVFRSDGDSTRSGFSLEWQAVSGCGSNDDLSGTSGSLTSVNYPNNYENNSFCYWVISAPVGMRVQAKFEKKFEIEPAGPEDCSFDSVKLQSVDENGNFSSSGNGSDRLGVFCGFSAPAGNFVSIGNKMAVFFHSDISAAYSGFSLKWKAFWACRNLDHPANGTVTVSDEDKINSKATYSCDHGFKLLGYNRRCLRSGEWSGSPPSCEEVGKTNSSVVEAFTGPVQEYDNTINQLGR